MLANRDAHSAGSRLYRHRGPGLHLRPRFGCIRRALVSRLHLHSLNRRCTLAAPAGTAAALFRTSAASARQIEEGLPLVAIFRQIGDFERPVATENHKWRHGVLWRISAEDSRSPTSLFPSVPTAVPSRCCSATAAMALRVMRYSKGSASYFARGVRMSRQRRRGRHRGSDSGIVM